MVTPWEMQIKSQLGNLKLKASISDMIKIQQKENNINLLPIQLNHIENLKDLPYHHRDPFDRLLISQAQIEKMKILTVDTKIKNYEIEVIN